MIQKKENSIMVEISYDEIKKALVDRIASDLSWKIDSTSKDKIFDSIDWSNLTPFIQEEIVKMAGKKLFGGKL